MPENPVKRSPVELDLRRYELRRGTRVLKLEKIPMELLILLAQKRDQLVGREEIIERLWGKDVFLDTEQGINTAVRKIRLALGDNPEQPHFLQTVVGKGYRLIGPIALVGGNGTEIPSPPAENPPRSIATPITHGPPRSRPWVILGVIALLAIPAVMLELNVLGLRQRRFGGHPAIHSLAVLPLENLSGDPAQDYFADGMTDELITNLAKISSLRVISRTSIVSYKGTHKPLPEVARALNVEAVVEGSVVRSGDQIRITAQLIYGPRDQHLWAEEYERDVRDVLTLQREVARDIAQQIKVALTPEEQVRLSSAAAINPGAYEAYLRGRSYWNQRTEAGLEKAIDQFNKAIAADPAYAQAYSGLADCYTTLGYFSYLDPKEAYPKAKVAAMKALELDPTLAEAHASLAYFNLYHAWNWVDAEKEFRQATALNPNYATAHEWYSLYLMAMNRMDESLAEIQRARELDPLSVAISTDLGFQYYYRKDYDGAISHLRGTLAINPKFPLAHLWLGRAYQQKRMYAEAVAEFNQADAALPNWVVTISGIGNVYGFWGKTAEAEQVLRRLSDMSKEKYVTPYGVALVYAGMGKNDEAFAWLNKAYEGRSHWLVWLHFDPRWEKIRSDPRYAELVQRLGLP